MKPQKMNSTLWYSLGLVLLLSIAIPVFATGTAFARYRTDEEHQANFRVEEAARVYMGKISFVEKDGELTDEVESFNSSTGLLWEDGNGVKTLTFSVANGKTQTEHYDKDQRFRLRIIAGANLIGEGENAPEAAISLVIPSEEGSETIEGTAKAIGTGTTLYREFGSGWVFTFLDENGEEIFWDLPGESFSYVTLTVSANVSVNIAEDVFFELEIEPEVIS